MLTDLDTQLILHALGLNALVRRSYRNRYWSPTGGVGPVSRRVAAMVERGLLKSVRVDDASSMTLYMVTDHGAAEARVAWAVRDEDRCR